MGRKEAKQFQPLITREEMFPNLSQIIDVTMIRFKYRRTFVKSLASMHVSIETI